MNPLSRLFKAIGNENAIELWLIGRLIPSEGVHEPDVVKLCDRIRTMGIWTHPIPVCRKSGLVMDGNHRLKAAEGLGLQRVPVFPLSYMNGRVTVRDRTHGGWFDLSRLHRVIHTHTPLPYKTTAHEFNPALPVVSIGLSRLSVPHIDEERSSTDWLGQRALLSA